MTGTVVHQANGKTGDDALIDALTSDDDTVRCMARLTQTPAMDALVQWVDDELNNRRTNPADVIFALMTVQTQFFASIVGSITPPQLDGQVEDAFHAEFKRIFVTHANSVRKSMAEAAS